MNSIIDFNQMAASIYDTIMSLLKSAEEMVGLDTLWCRALPHQGSEDVVILEYSLSNVECPQALKVVTDKGDYNAGTYNVDLWGVSFEAPLEISINIPTWTAIYGENTAPLKGDIVYIKLLNRLYEVASSTIQYTLTTLPCAYKCSLKKYQRTASRRESEEIRISIDELTNAQDTMFGDAISNEVADAVIERETSYNQSTTVDPIRTCDLTSIINENVLGSTDTLIAPAYYDFVNCEQPVIWNNIEASYGLNTDTENIYWMYSVWFRLNHKVALEQLNTADSMGNEHIVNATNEYTSNITLKGIYSKDKNNYQFFINVPSSDFSIGDDVILYRGNLITLSGKLQQEECGNRMVISIATADVLEASTKANKWWETLKNGWKIKKSAVKVTDSYGIVKQQAISTNLLSGYLDNELLIDITYNGVLLKLQFNNVKKNIVLPKLANNEWHYLLCEIGPGKLKVIIHAIETDTLTLKHYDKVVLNKEYKLTTVKDFSVNTFKLNNNLQDLNMCNIRLYENDTPLSDKYKIDMYSMLTRNASKLILVDNPLPGNRMDFVSPLR